MDMRERREDVRRTWSTSPSMLTSMSSGRGRYGNSTSRTVEGTHLQCSILRSPVTSIFVPSEASAALTVVGSRSGRRIFVEYVSSVAVQ